MKITTPLYYVNSFSHIKTTGNIFALTWTDVRLLRPQNCSQSIIFCDWLFKTKPLGSAATLFFGQKKAQSRQRDKLTKIMGIGSEVEMQVSNMNQQGTPSPPWY